MREVEQQKKEVAEVEAAEEVEEVAVEAVAKVEAVEEAVVDVDELRVDVDVVVVGHLSLHEYETPWGQCCNIWVCWVMDSHTPS